MFTTPLAIVTLAHHTFASDVGFLPHVEVIGSSALAPYVPTPYPEWIIPAESLLPMAAQVGGSQQKPIIASPVATSFANLPSKTAFRMPSATTLATWTERLLCSSDGCGAMPKSELTNAWESLLWLQDVCVPAPEPRSAHAADPMSILIRAEQLY